MGRFNVLVIQPGYILLLLLRHVYIFLFVFVKLYGKVMYCNILG